MSSPIRPTTSGASQAPTGFEDLLPAAAAPRPTTSSTATSTAAAAPSGFEDLVPQAPAASADPSTAAVLRAGAKALRQNMRSAAGWGRIGRRAYHGVVDPLATTAMFIGGSPAEIDQAVEHSSAQETKPTDPWYRPQVATTPDAQEGALEGTAMAALPVGELAGAALGKLAPGTFGALAARLAASRAGRATLAGASGAVHGAAIGAASQPGQRTAGAVVGGLAGGVAGAATQPIAEAVGNAAGPALDRAKGRVKSAIGDYLLSKQEAALNARRTGTNYYPETNPDRILTDQSGQAPPMARAQASATVDAQQGPELPDYSVEQNPGPGIPTAAHDGAHVQVERDSPTTLTVRARGHDVEASGVVPLPKTDADVDGLVQHIVGQYAPAVARGHWSWADLATLEGQVRGAIVAASHSAAPAMPPRQGPQLDPNQPRAPQQGPQPAPAAPQQGPQPAAAVAPVRLGPYPDLPAEDLAGHLTDQLATRTTQRDVATEQRDVALRDAQTDALTGLANQGAFARALPNAEAHPGTRVVRFDLNGMKAVNDGLGHPAGNAVLQTAAQAMVHGAAAAGVHARIFRVGGDEFAALVPATHADAFRTAVEQTYGVQDHAPGIRTSLSGGIGNTDKEADADTYARKAVQKAAHGIPERAAVSVVAPAPVAAPAAAPAPAAPTGTGPGTAVSRPRRVNWNPKAWRARYGAQLDQLSDEQLEEARGHLEAARAKAEPGSTADELLHRDILNVHNEQDGRARARGAEPDMKPETSFEQSLLTMERPQLEAELERHERALEAGLTSEDARTANRVVTLARRRLAELDRAPAALPAGPPERSATEAQLDDPIPGEEHWAKFEGKVRHRGATVTVHSHGPHLSMNAGGLGVFGGEGSLWPTDTDGLHQAIARILRTYANNPDATAQLSKTGSASAELDALHGKLFDLLAPHAPDPALVATERARRAKLNAEADARHAPDETPDETPAGFEDLLPDAGEAPPAANTLLAKAKARAAKAKAAKATSAGAVAELEREHAELFAELEQLHRDRKKPGANYLAERAPLAMRLEALEAELATHGITVPTVRSIGDKAKAPPRTAAQKKDLHKKPTQEEWKLAQTARYETTDRIRPLHTVAATALIDEIAALRDRIAERGGQTLYHPVENDRGEQVVVAHRQGGKGVSSQAKAMQNIADWQRNIDEIQQHLVATRGLTLEEVDELENQAHIDRADAAERATQDRSRGALEEEDDGDPLPFETSPRYGVHGQEEPLSSSYTVPEHRRRPLPDAPLTKTVATTTYPQPGGEPVRVHIGTSVAHGDHDPSKMDRGALYGAPPSGAYTTENPRVAGGIVVDGERTQYGLYPTAAAAETERAKLEQLTGPDTHDAIVRYTVEPEGHQFAVVSTSTHVAKRGYAHKATPDEAWLVKKIHDTEDEIARWMGGTHQQQRNFKEIAPELDAEERAEWQGKLKEMEAETHAYLQSLHASLERARTGAAPNVRVARLAVYHPFDVDRMLDEDPLHGDNARARILKAAMQLHPEYDWDYAAEQLDRAEQLENLDGERLYRILQRTVNGEGQKLGPTGTTEILEHAGYDAITHMGGGRTGGEPHRVWIPFHKASILSAFGDPRDAYMVGEPAPSYQGAHYRALLAERARRLTPEQAEQLTLTFGSPEKGLAVAAKVAADAGDFADVTYVTPTRANLYTGARTKNLERHAAQFGETVRAASVSILGQTMAATADVARLMRPFRDPLAEHLLVLLTDDAGTVLDFLHLSSGAINYVQPPKGLLKNVHDRALAVGATHVRLVHNHPSGDPTPSGMDGDVAFTLQIRDILQAATHLTLDPHVVLDHTHYGVIELLGGDRWRVTIHELEGTPPGQDWTAYGTPAGRRVAENVIDLETLRREHEAANPLQLTSMAAAAELVARAIYDHAGFHVVYLDTQLRAIAATIHTADAADTLDLWLSAHMREHAAFSTALVTSSVETAMRLGRHLNAVTSKQDTRGPDAPSRSALAALSNVVDVVYLPKHGEQPLTALQNKPRKRSDATPATYLRESAGQLGMFGAEPPPKPSKQDQLGMFGALEGTKLAQDEATKLANKDAKISPDELAQRRDELGAPKAAEIPTGPDQGALFERAPHHDAGDTSLEAVRSRVLATIAAARRSGEPLVVVTPCGSQKLDHRAPARHLYTGSYAQGAVRLADAIRASGVTVQHYILSAKHGLVSADQVLAPYDVNMAEYPITYSADRAQQQGAQLGLSDARMLVFGGERYAAVAQRAFPGATLGTPPGLGIGQQLRYMKQLAESLPNGEQGALFERPPREAVHQAAVRFRGQTFEGQTHWEAADAAAAHFELADTDEVYGTLTDQDEGFTTTRGRYVDRAEANRLFGGTDGDELRSEQLDPLYERAPRYGAGGPPTEADAMLREHPAEYGRELRDSFRRAFNPLARGELATQAGHVIRARTGEHAREIEVITDAAKAASRYFARLPKAEQLAFIDRMETGEPQPTPELQRFADAFRQGLDSARAAVQALGTGKLRDWIDNYFPHIWKDPKKAGIFFGKRPLEGSKSFLKKRSIPTIKDGIAAGLEPVTTNPADLTVLKLREMHKYILAWRIINELRALGLARWISVRRKPAENWTMIDDRVATKYGPPTVTVAHAEAFDAELRRQLAKVLEALGVQHDRTLTDRHAGPGTWGYAESSGRRIWSKFGGDVTVLIHELGHVLDDRFGLWDYLVGTPKKKLNSKGNPTSADSPEEIAARKTINAELRALADARYGEVTTDTYKKYVRKRTEKIANAIHAVLYAPELAARVAPTVTARLRAFLSSHAETRPLLALERSVRLGTAAQTKEYDTGGVVILAKLYAPDEVARVLNNYLSPGLRGSPYYNAYMGVGNLLNAAQLGLSAFHLGFTSLDAAVSKFALGLEQAIAGQPINAFRSIALSPVAPLTNAIRGDKVLREYLKPGSVGGEFFEIANAVAAAGGRVRMDEWYRVGQWKAMRQAMVETIRGADWTARGKGAMEAAVRALPAALELAAKPLMEYIVPRQKLGVFADLARLELDKLARKYPDGAPPDVARAALQRAWNSVDNRMGQMVYDNLFWHKVGKDLAHGGMRSVGWNVGTLREIGGGLTDTGRAALDGGRALRGMFGGGNGGNGGGKGPGAGGAADDGAPGRGPQRGPTDAPYFTHRMAYLVALPMFVGLAGALLQYLYTGEGPDSLKDLYYPRTGRKTPEGDDERLTLPSYMKDVFAARRHPAETVLHKASPLIDLIGAMLENKDYYGTQIHNPDDNTWRQLEQSLAYVGKSFLPFSLQGALEETKRGGSRVSRTLPMVGVTPAPKEVTRTAAQQAAFEIAQRRRQGIRTPEESELGQQKGDLVRRARAGEAIGPELQRLVQAGEITVADAKRILKARLTSAETRRFQSLTVEQARGVMQQATPEERAALGPLMARKIRSAAQRHALPLGSRGQEPPHDP